MKEFIMVIGFNQMVRGYIFSFNKTVLLLQLIQLIQLILIIFVNINNYNNTQHEKHLDHNDPTYDKVY